MAGISVTKQSSPVADAGIWEKNPFGCRIGSSFNTFKEAIEFAIAPDLKANQNVETAQTFLENLPEYYAQPNLTDTSIGGNDAINAFWQFNIDDDIIHPMLASDSPDKCDRGLGRVYNEMYQSNMQMLWLSFGVPQYHNLRQFWTGSVSSELSTLMNTGTVPLGVKIGTMIGKAVRVLAFDIPLAPYTITAAALRGVEERRVTKYYGMRPAMPLYFRIVNTILAHLSVNMGLFPDNKFLEVSTPAQRERIAQYTGNGQLPEVLENGPDIFAMMDKRYRRTKKQKQGKVVDEAERTTDSMLQATPSIGQNTTENGESTLTPNASNGLYRSMLGAIEHAIAYGFDLNNYVGFRIEKGTDASESINNSTGESPVAAQINAKISANRERTFMSMAGQVGIPGLDEAIGVAVAAVKTAASTMGADAATEIISGNGYYDIPEVWKNSSFAKSYSFHIQLRSRYGDPVSIFQSIYVPLAMILAAALPRGTGSNTYTSPFLLEAYAKGMFAIPLGIIDSVTIRRGASEYGWTYDHLPTAVDIDISIKDLSPAFFLSIDDNCLLTSAGKVVTEAFKNNSTMHEYLNTLSGLTIRERSYLGSKLQRRWNALLRLQKTTNFSSLYWMNVGGNNSLVRFFTNMLPGWVPPET